MSRLIILFYCNLLLLVSIHASSTESDENTLEFDSEIVDEREKLVDTITDEYMEILDYEIDQCKQLFEQVLEDRNIKHTRSEILQSKKMILQNYIEYVTERQQRKMPPQTHRAARFFHVFGKSLLYKDFVGIVARLEPTRSRYDDLIEVALFTYGIEDFLGTVREKRDSLIAKTTRRIDRFVKGLTASERRKAAAQKMTDWSEKMKAAEALELKMDIFRDFLRYEHLHSKVPVVDY